MRSWLNIPAGELFELIRPFVTLISILLSAWVLASARKRFRTAIAFMFAIGALFLPLVATPIYVALILLWRWPVRPRRWPLLLPLGYAVLLTVWFGFVFYRDSQAVDAHLARAVQAKLTEDHAAAISEYRRALEIENDPHTHKLLALELAQTGQLDAAASEFRLAQQGGELISCAEAETKCKEGLDRVNGTSR